MIDHVISHMTHDYSNEGILQREIVHPKSRKIGENGQGKPKDAALAHDARARVGHPHGQPQFDHAALRRLQRFHRATPVAVKQRSVPRSQVLLLGARRVQPDGRVPASDAANSARFSC